MGLFLFLLVIRGKDGVNVAALEEMEMEMEKKKVYLGILRKSPSNKEKKVAVSLDIQKKAILKRIAFDVDSGLDDLPVVWAVDVCSGDDPNRVDFLFKVEDPNFEVVRAYCLNVDRFSRSWLGIKWFHEYFLDRELHFVEGMGNLYDDEGGLIHESYLFFFIQCGFAQYELLKIRSRTRAGIEKLKQDPKLWAVKYSGRPKGAKDKKKRKKRL